MQASAKYYDVDEAASTIRELAEEVKPGLRMSLKGMFSVGRRKDRQLIQTLGLGFVRGLWTCGRRSR